MEEKHVHRYEIQVSDEWVIRWCPVCGKSWILMKELIGSQYVWVEIEEREEEDSKKAGETHKSPAFLLYGRVITHSPSVYTSP